MMKKAEILIVDDDAEIRKIINQYLTDDGYVVHSAANAAEARDFFSQKVPDLILLDMVLPDIDGLALMTEFHGKAKTPIIVVSGRSDATDRIIGLEMGADDYLTKPFHMRELSARIKSVLRRAEERSTVKDAGAAQQDEKADQVLAFGKWTMYCGRYEVCNDQGTPLSLTSGEFELLHALATSSNRVMRREQLFEITRGTDYDAYDRAVDIQIGRLRKKLNDDPQSPSLIKTVRGIGYIFIGDVRKVS
jgi:DNA-binding response OmpR family regulator